MVSNQVQERSSVLVVGWTSDYTPNAVVARSLMSRLPEGQLQNTICVATIADKFSYWFCLLFFLSLCIPLSAG